ncbi:MAG: SMP-30/gluconolactonase/LRE family protein, partial [Acidobacteria bacterium]|nr:SMP-30/gluconolactonase/LRE family protein [Acidobacteriota bacterium]
MVHRWMLPGILTLIVACGGASPDPADTPPPDAAPSAGTIERLDPALDALLPPDAVIEQIGSGFRFTEGPAWVPQGEGFLLFSDIPANTIFKWSPDGAVTKFLSPIYAGEFEDGRLVGSNGIVVSPDGGIVFTEHFNGRISRVDGAGTVSVVVDKYQGKRFNSPNDLVYKSDGSLYFTDPPYGLPSQEAKELDVNGVYRLGPDGVVTRLAEQPGPNGLAFSPDESRLYVADSTRSVWMVYEVSADGTLDAGTVFL